MSRTCGILHISASPSRSRTNAESEMIAYRDRLEELVRARTKDLEIAVTRLRRLAAAIAQTTEGVILANPSGMIDFVNHAFTQITGIAQAHAKGQSLTAVGIPWHTDLLKHGCWQGSVQGIKSGGSAVRRIRSEPFSSPSPSHSSNYRT